jgi:hypothetical protein
MKTPTFKIKLSDGTEAVAQRLTNKEVADILSGKANLTEMLGLTEEKLTELMESLPKRNPKTFRM